MSVVSAKRGRPPIVSLDAIVDTAIALIDADGVERFSLRRVADEMGVANMTLYGHIADKNELLRLVVDRVLGDVDTGDLDDHAPMVAMSLVTTRIRTAFLAHPAICPLLARPEPVFAANGARVLEAQFATLARAGLTPPQALELYGLFLTMQLGGLVVEQVGVERVLVGDLQDALDAARASGEAIDTTYLANVVDAAPMAAPEGRFPWMLEVLLAGIEAVGLPLDDGSGRRRRPTDR